jgi:hypothetical protein
MDASPGRLNQVTALIHSTGYAYGQCSELCGVNHSFMPIVVEAVVSAYNGIVGVPEMPVCWGGLIHQHIAIYKFRKQRRAHQRSPQLI